MTSTVDWAHLVLAAAVITFSITTVASWRSTATWKHRWCELALTQQDTVQVLRDEPDCLNVVLEAPDDDQR